MEKKKVQLLILFKISKQIVTAVELCEGTVVADSYHRKSLCVVLIDEQLIKTKREKSWKIACGKVCTDHSGLLFPDT